MEIFKKNELNTSRTYYVFYPKKKTTEEIQKFIKEVATVKHVSPKNLQALHGWVKGNDLYLGDMMVGAKKAIAITRKGGKK